MKMAGSTMWRVISTIAAVVVALSALITLGLGATNIVQIKSQLPSYVDTGPRDYPVQTTVVSLASVTLLFAVVAAVLHLLQTIQIVVGVISAILTVFWLIFWIYVAQDLGTHHFGEVLSSCSSDPSRFSVSASCTLYYIILAWLIFSVITDILLLIFTALSFVAATRTSKNNKINQGNHNNANIGMHGVNEQPVFQQGFQQHNQVSSPPSHASPYQQPQQPPQGAWLQGYQQPHSPQPDMQQQNAYRGQFATQPEVPAKYSQGV